MLSRMMRADRPRTPPPSIDRRERLGLGIWGPAVLVGEGVSSRTLGMRSRELDWDMVAVGSEFRRRVSIADPRQLAQMVYGVPAGKSGYLAMLVRLLTKV